MLSAGTQQQKKCSSFFYALIKNNRYLNLNNISKTHKKIFEQLL